MKNTLRLMKENLEKVITNPVFYLSIAAVTIIYLAGQIYVDEFGKSYSLISVMTSSNRSELINKFAIDYQYMIYSEPGSYSWMFAGILASLPTVMLISSAKKNTNVRFELYRTGKWSYSIAQMLSAMLSGGFIIAFGYGIYCVLLRLVIGTGGAGTILSLVLNEKWICNLVASLGFMPLFLLKLISMFIWGMYMTLAVYVCSAVINNKYLVLCIPFMFNYLLNIIFLDIDFVRSFVIFSPDHMKYIIFNYNDRTKLTIIFFVMTFLSLVIYRWVLGRKVDCSE